MVSKSIIYAVNALTENNINAGKTFIQKLFYFAFSTEERDELFIPYFFGPYSNTIQSLLNGLILNDYLKYENNKLSSDFEVKFNTSEKKFLKRIDKTINFLLENDVATTKDISLLAKTHMILENNEYNLDTSVNLVKERALLLGWNELSNLSKKNIERFISLSRKLV